MKSKIVERELTLRLSDTRRVTVELKATGVLDSNYGADADGNRGMPVWFIDDVTWDLPDTDDDGNTLSESDRKIVDGLLNLKVDDVDWDD